MKPDIGRTGLVPMLLLALFVGVAAVGVWLITPGLFAFARWYWILIGATCLVASVLLAGSVLRRLARRAG